MDASRSAYSSYGHYGGINEFDLISFLKKPLVLLRIIAIIFSIVVFGCIATNQNGKGCPYVDGGACGYGSGVGVVAFLALIAFLVLDAVFDSISDVNNRKYIIISELTFNGVWTFLWFVCFCYLTDTWRKQEHKTEYNVNCSQAAIAFSFFSIVIFVALTVMSLARYRRGSLDDFMPFTVPPSYPDSQNSGNSGYYQSYNPAEGRQSQPATNQNY